MDKNFLDIFVSKRVQSVDEIWVSEESERIFKKKKVNKSTSVCREWSNEKTTLHASQIFQKRPDLR